MCLYPKLIKNRKYTVTKKNGGNVPEIKDPRTQWVPIGCQKCIECKNQKARAWSIRLQEEIRTNKSGKFVTLTFSNQSIKQLHEDIEHGLEGYELDNELATLAVRRFLERWRKKYRKSVKHWLITEIGEGKTDNSASLKLQGDGNIHLHGIIFTDKPDEIEKIWQYGFVFIGQYVNEKTINYCMKYMTKMDFNHKEYNAKILTSPGIGNHYIQRHDAQRNRYTQEGTDERYVTRQGTKLNLPVYYRNKIYSEEEREKLWIEKLDKQERWVMGQKVSIKNGDKQYYQMLQHARKINRRLGYGNDEKDWSRINYENTRRKMNMEKRLADELA